MKTRVRSALILTTLLGGGSVSSTALGQIGPIRMWGEVPFQDVPVPTYNFIMLSRALKNHHDCAGDKKPMGVERRTVRHARTREPSAQPVRADQP
ncbi:MAG: hypothetical protein ACKVW3_08310, partial [Phycisphaerales bacterium]